VVQVEFDRKQRLEKPGFHFTLQLEGWKPGGFKLGVN
jgi:hypothetical protein